MSLDFRASALILGLMALNIDVKPPKKRFFESLARGTCGSSKWFRPWDLAALVISSA